MEIGFAAVLILFIAVVLPVWAYVTAITRLMKLTVNVQKAPVPLDPNTNPFPTLLGEHFDRVQSGLRGQGFESVADYALAEMIPDCRRVCTDVVNRTGKRGRAWLGHLLQASRLGLEPPAGLLSL